MTSRGLALIAVASLAPLGSAIAAADHLIRPGVGAGGVRLGMSEGQVVTVLGRPDSREVVRTEFGPFVDLSWPGITVRRWGTSGGRVVDVEVTGRGIRMANGIGVGSPLARVRRAFPAITCETRPTVCMIGDAVPGARVTTLRFDRRARVRSVSVGRVID